MSFTRRTLTVDGQRLAVFEAGAGEPCVLLHGYPQDHRCWARVAPALAETHRVIAPDWFGCGDSERSLTDAPVYEVEVDRIRQLFDALGIARANLACHDYGGFLGMGFAQRHPERLLRLAIINSRCQGAFSPLGLALFGGLVALARLPFGEALFAGLPLHAIHERAMQRYVRNGSFSAAELESYLAFLRSAHGRRWLGHFFRHFQPTRRRELRGGCARLALPAAVIWGDHDTYSRFEIAEELAALLPNAELTRVAGADHYVMEERPAEVAAALARWLARPV